MGTFDAAAETHIRAARVEDTALIRHFIRELAEYERMSDQALPTVRGYARRSCRAGRIMRAAMRPLARTPIGGYGNLMLRLCDLC